MTKILIFLLGLVIPSLSKTIGTNQHQPCSCNYFILNAADHVRVTPNNVKVEFKGEVYLEVESVKGKFLIKIIPSNIETIEILRDAEATEIRETNHFYKKNLIVSKYRQKEKEVLPVLQEIYHWNKCSKRSNNRLTIGKGNVDPVYIETIEVLKDADTKTIWKVRHLGEIFPSKGIIYHWKLLEDRDEANEATGSWCNKHTIIGKVRPKAYTHFFKDSDIEMIKVIKDADATANFGASHFYKKYLCSERSTNRLTIIKGNVDPVYIKPIEALKDATGYWCNKHIIISKHRPKAYTHFFKDNQPYRRTA